MAVQQREPGRVEYVEVPELGETFADSLHTMIWDGQTLRIEFCVTRYPDAPADGAAPNGKRYPACRLVLTAPGVAALYNPLQQTVAVLADAGVTSKPPPQPSGSAQH